MTLNVFYSHWIMIRNIFILYFLAFSFIHPWSEHGMGTYPALEVMEELKKRPNVKVETLESFLLAEKENIEKLLKKEEKWLEKNVPTYPLLPEKLIFKADNVNHKNIRIKFLYALRLNPNIKIEYFVYIPPGKKSHFNQKISYKDLTVFKNPKSLNVNDYYKIKSGDIVKPIEIIATASDEPDYGHDIGIWEDNKTDFGKIYKIGKQPFGDPRLEYSSQAPIHMGFYHEAWIVNVAAGYLKHTYPEYRIHMFQSLAKLAFETGHNYWGYRFTGWGLHYIEDLTMPYHSTVLPGVGWGKMVWIAIKNMFGFGKDQKENLLLVSNRHTLLERFQRSIMRDKATQNKPSQIFKALRNTENDSIYGKYNHLYPRKIIAKESNDRSTITAEKMEEFMPKEMVFNPYYQCHKDWQYPYQTMTADNIKNVHEMEKELSVLFSSFGSHARNYVRYVITSKI